MPIAKTKSEWWSLVRADLRKWNSENHEDDRLGIQDWIEEVGPKIHGWIAFTDRDGDWDVSLSGFPEDDEDDEADD